MRRHVPNVRRTLNGVPVVCPSSVTSIVNVSVRFGTGEAHGKGMLVQFNYLLDHGGFTANPDGTFSVNMDKIKEAVKGLTRDLMTLQAEGDYQQAKEMLTKVGNAIRPEMERALTNIKNVPVDIEPKFTTAEQLLREFP